MPFSARKPQKWCFRRPTSRIFFSNIHASIFFILLFLFSARLVLLDRSVKLKIKTPKVFKIKSDFWIERSYPKNIFCVVNLVRRQIYRVDKVGKYFLSLSKNSIVISVISGPKSLKTHDPWGNIFNNSKP